MNIYNVTIYINIFIYISIFLRRFFRRESLGMVVSLEICYSICIYIYAHKYAWKHQRLLSQQNGFLRKEKEQSDKSRTAQEDDETSTARCL